MNKWIKQYPISMYSYTEQQICLFSGEFKLPTLVEYLLLPLIDLSLLLEYYY